MVHAVNSIRRKISTTTRPNPTDNSDNQTLFEDYVTKSPPFEKMKNLSSYNRRWLALIKSKASSIVKTDSDNKADKRLKSEDHVEWVYYLKYWTCEEDKKREKKPKSINIPYFP